MNRFTVPKNGRHMRTSDSTRPRRDQARSLNLQTDKLLKGLANVLNAAKK